MGNQNKINRGKKWADIKKNAEIKQDSKTLEWLESQKAIVEDIETYELTQDPKADVDHSIKTKAELKKLADKAGIAYEATSTKDELIVLLETKDEAKEA